MNTLALSSDGLVDDPVPPQAEAETFGKEYHRLQPIRALKALRKLIANKEDTYQVFEILRALTGRSIPKGYERLLDSPAGGRIAYRRPELAEKFCDAEWLAQFPEGSVGAAYRKFITTENISAEGLAEESRKSIDSDIDAEHPLAWYGRRLRDVHDVWHVLTGYGRDGLGEACLVAFSYAQSRSAGLALIAFAGAREISKVLPHRPIRKAVWEGYQHGRKAAWLPAQDYEALFAMPLEVARKRLNILPPETYRTVPPEERDSAMTLQ